VLTAGENGRKIVLNIRNSHHQLNKLHLSEIYLAMKFRVFLTVKFNGLKRCCVEVESQNRKSVEEDK